MTFDDPETKPAKLTDTDAGASEREIECLADIVVKTAFSIIVPTYKEVENIRPLLDRFERFRRETETTFEVIFMDDDSRDGSVEVVESSGYDWARIVVRHKDRGLSQSVVDGFRNARFPVLVCMDCDLSHPVEKIPALILSLASGQQMAIGSRYVFGGSTDDDWGIFRWLNSRIATILARPLTRVKDPMSGFFALRRSSFSRATDLRPIGYKIGLELIVKCGFENVAEVPIDFKDRVHGESKLTIREQLKFIRHLRLLYMYKFSEAMHLAQFLVVGVSGVVVNLSVLSIFAFLGAATSVAVASGIAVSIVTNFLLNRRFSFSYARKSSALRQFSGFVGASSVGMVVNYVVTLYFANNLISADNPLRLQVAALIGIAAGMAFNFVGNRFIVFKKKYVRRDG